MTYTCLIVDDEPLAIEILETYVQKTHQIEVIGTFYSAVDAFESLKQNLPDLLLIDIKMPGLNGIELIKSLAKRPQVIFTTAHKNFAHHGFELDAVDYLLKPISLPRFQKAIEKYLRVVSADNVSLESNSLFVKSDGKWITIPYVDILYVEGIKDYVKIHTQQKRVLVHSTMKDLVYQLPDQQFLRIHRSFIVNWRHVAEVEGYTFKVNNQVLPVGKTYRATVLTHLKARQSN